MKKGLILAPDELSHRWIDRLVSLGVVSAILFFAAILFVCGRGESIAHRVMVFAICLLATGLINLLGASTLPASPDAPEWPMIQGLLDVMMAIMLFMSYSTRVPSLLLILMAIWAVMGAVARLFSAFRVKGTSRRKHWFNIVDMLAGGGFLLAGALLDTLDPSLCIGIGLAFGALGSVWIPSRRKGRHG